VEGGVKGGMKRKWEGGMKWTKEGMIEGMNEKRFDSFLIRSSGTNSELFT
jgi:hypothetical protein